MKKIVTIWGGNGQSNLLDAIQQYFPKKKYHISSIVSMSDDGRTTGELMRKFQDELWLHLPPPGDLRRCLFMMSNSHRRDEFQQYLETIIERDIPISELNVWDYFRIVGADEEFRKHLQKMKSLPLFHGEDSGEDFLCLTLPLTSSIKWHKVWNILMANLYYNLGKDYYKMLEVMHEILQVDANIIPVTTQRAYIRAVLGNGEVIESQDRISNVASYSAWIADIELMDNSKYAYQHKNVFKAIKKADYIIISPWDLYTSIISNFVIWWVKEGIRKSDAKIICIGNSTNKWGETQWLTHLDIIAKIERFLGRKIDIFICNNKKIELSNKEKEIFQSNISIKWWDYLFLSKWEKEELEKRKVQIYEAELLDEKTFYKHHKKALVELLEKIL